MVWLISWPQLLIIWLWFVLMIWHTQSPPEYKQSSWDYSWQLKRISHPVELTPFNDFDTHITEETNKHKWPSIVVQGSKGWDQSIGHYHCNRTSGAPESLHPALNNLMRCIFQFQFTRLFSASCGFEFFLWDFFWQKTGF